ncbi:MAG TPA: amidohydrolase [Holophaga sp.]|nr:amidohydrolase [Holophaga sp.]HPS66878.1 amidohydrolase [Holophaga sp.]
MHADLILTGGRIYTVDPARPWIEAVAVVGDRIAAVGSREDIAPWAGPATRVVDLEGRFVLPGLIDSHVHFIQGGQALSSVQLRGVASREEFRARLGAYVEDLPEGEWVVEGNWDHQCFTKVELPRKEWIDDITPRHPVCLNRLDGHMALCNSVALRLAHIGRDTPDVPGGEIVRDPATGEPTGILKDAAADLVYQIFPPPTRAQLRRMAEASLRAAAEKGVTTVHDVSGEAGFDAYQDLLKEGRLTTRISFYLPITFVSETVKLKLKSGFGSARLRFAGLKGFADGSLGSSTASFFDPYLGTGNRGLFHSQMFPEGIMKERVQAADQGDLQVAIHAIGDRAIDALLGIFEEVEQAGGERDRRFRMEHAQHVRPEDFARFARGRVIASVQPYHAIDDGRWAGSLIDEARLAWAFPYRSFLDAGVALAFGSDWPVAPMDPILAIHAAVTRQTLDGRHPDGWIPEQKISLEAAIHASTLGGAWAEFAEAEKGSITPGKLADVAVLDRDLFRIRPEEIKDAHVSMTLCGGEVVYRNGF